MLKTWYSSHFFDIIGKFFYFPMIWGVVKGGHHPLLKQGEASGATNKWH